MSQQQHRILSMPFDEFLSLPPYQGQRRTEKHADRIFETIRHAPPETLRGVAVVEYRDGKREILDGNSRHLLWKTNKLSRPRSVNCSLFYCENAEAARPFYEAYNSAISVKSARDETVSAMRLCGWTPKSAVCRDATLRTPLCLAEGNVRGTTYLKGTSQYEIMPLWLEELKMFDEIAAAGITRGRTHSAITAAFLMTVRAHGEEVLPFWRTWFSDGWKGATPDVPMNKLYTLFLQAKSKLVTDEGVRVRRGTGGTGGSVVYRLLCGIIYIVERWRRGDEMIESQRFPAITDYCNTGNLPAIKRSRRRFDDEEDELAA